ncbi:hypothetical protein [Luteolibacter luteus]|uniref:HEAT repeat domain-containing protein n=1 Tax=Luteolibacter luteus TaxID=2728835 RepID=A0A858RLY4_9BACT|nr:hypothetical protein [Luteolibacter luteus]QJE97832.1 hypothetical protein HHL09_19265 [Luteolibacter luteus]
MSSKNLTIAGAVVLASAGAFFAGRMTAPAGNATADKSAAESQMSGKSSRRSLGGGESSGSLSGARDGARGEAKGATARGEAAVAKMEEMMRLSDPMDRNKAWMEFINSIDPAEFESIVASFRGLGMTNTRMTEYSMLLSAWAKKDPLQALAYAEANTGNRFARNTILSTWAASDPDGAIRWAQEHFNGDEEDGNPWMIGVIQGLAGTDPVRASQLLTSMNFSEERGEAMAALLPTILAQGPEAAQAWATAITDDNLKQGAIGRVAEALAAKDPAGTAAWLAENPGEAAQRSMDNVLSTWMEQDKDAAMAYYKTLPSGDVRTNALRGVASSLALENPQAAADFLDQNAAYANDRVYQQFAWSSFGQAPDLAANYIGKITDAREQERMYDRMIGGWMRRDFNAATNWINSTSLPTNVSERLHRRVQQMQERQQ